MTSLRPFYFIVCVVTRLASEAVVAENAPISFEDPLSECAEEISGNTNLLQTQLSFNKRQIFERQDAKTASRSIEAENENTIGVLGALSFDWANKTQPSSGCGESVPSNIRILLSPIVPAFHGSTSLEGVFMSSDQVTTLCSAQTWQCEVMDRRNGDYTKMLQTYCKIWDLDRPIFLYKSLDVAMGVPVEIQRNGILHASLPAELRAKGVTTLRQAYVLMWRPICLAPLSSHARMALQESPSSNELKELLFLEQVVKNYKYLVNVGEPVLVVNYADLIWRPDRTQQRLSSFLPCLGDIDIDYIPKLGTDIYPLNNWKEEGTSRSFGLKNDPQACCGYDLSTSSCEQSFMHLAPPLQSKAANILSFLQSVS